MANKGRQYFWGVDRTRLISQIQETQVPLGQLLRNVSGQFVPRDLVVVL